MLELLAPNTAAARQFVAQALSCLDTKGATQNDVADGPCLQSLVCFGRQPQETIALLSSLGTAAHSAANGAGLVTGSGGGGGGEWAGAMAPLGDGDDQPVLCEYLRYRCVL